MDHRQETLLNLRKTATGLLIPTRMNEEPRFRCNIPGCDWRGYTHTEQVIQSRSTSARTRPTSWR
jgi:hypothetical protein